MSKSDIAKLIGISKSTVSREIKNNSNMHRHYVAIDVQQFAERKKTIPRRPRKLSKEDWQEIVQCIHRHWSPRPLPVFAGKRARTASL